MRTLTGVLAILLAIFVGLCVWQGRDAKFSAQLPSAPEHSSNSSKSTIAPTLADAQGSGAVSSSQERQAVHEVTGESVTEEIVADTLAGPTPHVDPVITSDLPSYLNFYAREPPPTFPPDECNGPFELLVEMNEAPRDDVWASRVERELHALLQPHPLGFHVTITCRAAICQVTALGPGSQIREKETEYNAYWSEFMEKLRHAPFAPEFVTARFFGAAYVEDPTQDIAGFVFTTVGHPAATKSPDCANFKPSSARD
jgi:hypothetical protein